MMINLAAIPAVLRQAVVKTDNPEVRVAVPARFGRKNTISHPDERVVQRAEMLRKAYNFAAKAHARQVRKEQGAPYVVHLMGVSALVLEYEGTIHEAMAALLHDTVEDQGVTFQTLEEKFGKKVADIVAGCTEDKSIPDWRERKEAFIDSLKTASSSVRMVVAADKINNIQSLVRGTRMHREGFWEKFGSDGRQRQLWYLRAVTEQLKQVEITPIVEELDRNISQLEGLLA